MNNIAEKTIREIALEAPATTRVFEEFKIDYCCGGRRSIADACATAGFDPSALTERINLVMNAARTEADADHPEDKKPTELIGYILAKHHIFTAQEIRRLVPLMAKVISRHGDNHAELLELGVVFEDLCNSLLP